MMIASLLVCSLPKIDVDRSVRFLRALRPGLTLAQVKTLGGKGVTFGRPEWRPPIDGSLPGFVVRISGGLVGSVSFMDQAHRKLLLEGEGQERWSEQQPIFGALMTVDLRAKESKAAGRAVIDRLAKLLGKPVSTPSYSKEWANDFGGWSTSFKVGGRKAGFYQCNMGEVESRLELLFQQPLY